MRKVNAALHSGDGRTGRYRDRRITGGHLSGLEQRRRIDVPGQVLTHRCASRAGSVIFAAVARDTTVMHSCTVHGGT